ncbi:TVP38/TMEM64 family protein [Dongia deserti]|uniref:TVP38/TMEM64 family protein n=1 Tax=Dongia deserti TaxID=2268030 RepID=UPI0013C529AC|nr:VTT domain-containing protein [Dongia deserti]
MVGPHELIPNDGSQQPRRAAWRRWLPLGVIALGLILVFAFDLDRFASFQHLRAHHQLLAEFVAAHYVEALICYLLLYVSFVALSLPGAIWLTVAAGFLFGAMVGAILAVIAATTGATLLFLAAKTSLGDYLHTHAGPWLAKVERGFADNQWSYLLMMRLFPVIPFFIANLVPAFLGVPLPVFIITTFVGIIPATAIFATVGAGLGSVLKTSADLSLHSLMTPEVEGGLVGLAILAAAPIAVKYLRRRRAARDR